MEVCDLGMLTSVSNIRDIGGWKAAGGRTVKSIRSSLL